MPTPFDGGPRGYRCVICNRPAARYRLKELGNTVADICDVCMYYLFTMKWDVIGQRNAIVATQNLAPTWPYPEPPPYSLDANEGAPNV